jgi:hypothetical protein
MTTKTQLINRSAVREKALAVLQYKRPHLAAKFTRVGSEFFQAIEGHVIYAIEQRIESMPTSGKTLR